MQPVVARRWVWAIGGASFLGQLAVGSLTRAPSWDEAIYLSQVTRGAQALPFVASRARGITLLVAPLTSIGAPLWAVRLLLAIASSLVLVLVFRLWVPVVGTAAVVGAGLFAASWPALFYGTEAMPNLWAALLAVGVVGCVVRVEGRGAESALRHAGAYLALTAAAMGLMRPPDAVVLGLTLTVTALVLGTPARPLFALWLGVAAGVLPWIVETSLRFGGPVGAVEEASRLSHLGGDVGGPSAHLALTDGPLLGPDATGGIPVVGLAWWVGLVVLAMAASINNRNGPAAIGARCAAFAGLALAGVYVFWIGGLAPRFLLPALALLSLAAGTGIERLRSRSSRPLPVLALGGLVLAGWCAWQVATFDRLEASGADERAIPQAVGEAIADHVGPSDCLVASTHDFPQVAFAARCTGGVLGDLSAGFLDGLRVAAGDRPIIVVSRETTVERLGSSVPLPVEGWVAFEL